ncbi:tRNA-splicing endonuclease subunit sen54 [Vermiconidia calcicola]|uniref:tRNA-splicing endonuclease subunit sen54 n=1 Tax=Vermiconidia calcicola TaxID=1690605 RepID=A0ACC3NQM2_9PEZI|nr:tRNA-splicing endonuclease subunit sen54 [Vermiconidia calcicola]
MADADEDVIPQGGASAEETDLSDETQDFRFLATISREDAAVPKRGEKDFEPHATALQSNTLAASRQAMHNALSFQRVHPPKGHNIATYHPETNTSYVYDPKGPHFARMGHVKSARDDPLGNDEFRGQRMWLLPEEVLYLLERGSLDVRWPADDGEDGAMGLTMSLQGAYAMFIGDEEAHAGALTFERYSVFASLKRMGFTVLRAPSWSNPDLPPTRECFARPTTSRYPPWHIGLIDYYRPWLVVLSPSEPRPDREETAKGPLVRSRLYRSYDEIYRRLALIPFHDPAKQSGPIHYDADLDSDSDSEYDPNQSLCITYHVWKPGSQTYKKSAPGPPDFRIAVVNARETTVPTLEQLSHLMDTVPFDPPVESAQLYQKLRHGYKNVILAIVDQGVVSYLRVAEAAFGREKLYERRGKGPAGKRGGRGGRGRGR